MTSPDAESLRGMVGTFTNVVPGARVSLEQHATSWLQAPPSNSEVLARLEMTVAPSSGFAVGLGIPVAPERWITYTKR